MKNNLLSNPQNANQHTIKWLLDVGYYHGTMSESQARKIARVSNLTFDRWLSGETSPPGAAVELLRLHAYGEPPCGTSTAWAGFRFQNETLTTPDGRTLTPADLLAVFFWKQAASEYFAMKKRDDPNFKPYEQLVKLYAV